MVPCDVELSVAPSLKACKRVTSSNSGRMKENAMGLPMPTMATAADRKTWPFRTLRLVKSRLKPSQIHPQMKYMYYYS